MKNLHEKSPCCRGKVLRFGKRRRQCKLCKKTWRAWQKKLGRKQNRASPEFAKKYLKREIVSLYVLARSGRKTESKLKHKLKKSLDKFLRSTRWLAPPSNEPVIIIADAMIITIGKQPHAIYFVLLKPINSNKAVIAEPHIKKGTESWLGWQETFSKLPTTTLASICALVSDGHKGLVSAAKRRGWLHQRCHFHLIALIQGRRSRWARSRHRKEGERLYQLVQEVITTTSDYRLKLALVKLGKMRFNTTSPTLKKTLSGLIRFHQEYRTYLYYPELNLPRTSNSAESVISSIRFLLQRARGFRTTNSLMRWVYALLKLKQTATCNGNSSTNLMS